MKETIFILVILFTSLSCFSQNAIYTRGKGYKGYIFDKNHSVFESIENKESRYTPTIEDIKKAEIILKDNVKEIKAQSKLCSSSLENTHFKKYIRQYVGFINNDGDIIIWINMINEGSIFANEFSEDIVMVLDGGNNFWSIFINITKKSFYGLSVNGIA